MKKSLLYFVLFTLCLTACKKDKKDNPPPSGKTYDVTFNVSGSGQVISSEGKQEINSLKTNAIGPAASLAKLLFYLVYDSNGALFHQIKQDSTMDNFGRISDNLPAGTYTVYIVAGQRGLGEFGDPSQFGYPNTEGPGAIWKDLFYKKLTITVTNTAINQDVTLARVVGQLQINVEDAIPANAAKFVVKITDESIYFDFKNGIMGGAYGGQINNTIPASAIGTTNYKITRIIGNTLTPMSVQIICYDSANIVIADKTINNVNCDINVKTILSGKLFAVSNGFVVGLNNTWDPTPYTTIGY